MALSAVWNWVYRVGLFSRQGSLKKDNKRPESSLRGQVTSKQEEESMGCHSNPF